MTVPKTHVIHGQPVAGGSKIDRASAGKQADERGRREHMPSRRLVDGTAAGLPVNRQPLDAERDQPEVVVVGAVAPRRAGTGIADPAEVVDGLAQPRVATGRTPSGSRCQSGGMSKTAQ